MLIGRKNETIHHLRGHRGVREDHPDRACGGLAEGARHPRSSRPPNPAGRRSAGRSGRFCSTGDPAPIGAEAELLLFAAARAQHVRETILPALKAGQWVLCDRFADATLAYQGFGRGLDAGFIRTLNAFSAQVAEAGSDAPVRPARGDRSGAGEKTGGRRPARGGGGPFRAGGKGLSREDPRRVSDPRRGGAGTLPDHRRRGGSSKRSTARSAAVWRLCRSSLSVRVGGHEIRRDLRPRETDRHSEERDGQRPHRPCLSLLRDGGDREEDHGVRLRQGPELRGIGPALRRLRLLPEGGAQKPPQHHHDPGGRAVHQDRGGQGDSRHG